MFESSQLAQKETALSIMPSNIPHFMSGPRGHGVMERTLAYFAGGRGSIPMVGSQQKMSTKMVFLPFRYRS